MHRIVVFCGAATGVDPKWSIMAADVGRTLAARGIGIVYGGGHVGLMRIVADAAM